MSLARYRPEFGQPGRVVQLPFTRDLLVDLHAGELLWLTGPLFAAREQTLIRLVALHDAGAPLPCDLRGQVLAFLGLSPASPGRITGAVGPVTAGRLDPWTPRLLGMGLAATLAKGRRSAAVRQAQTEHGAVFLATIGGAGAFLAHCVRCLETVAFADAGEDALLRLEVEDFPAVVINDVQGRDLYEVNNVGVGVGNR